MTSNPKIQMIPMADRFVSLDLKKEVWNWLPKTTGCSTESTTESYLQCSYEFVVKTLLEDENGD